MNYIAELISLLSDMQIRGSIPEKLETVINEYTTQHESEEKEMREQLFNKLSQLTAEAIKYSKSDIKAEQQYGAELLKYVISQKEAVLNGKNVIYQTDMDEIKEKMDQLWRLLRQSILQQP